MTTTELQGWALALRDLVEQGADAASVTFHGASIAYAKGMATLTTPHGRTDFSDADLDEVGLVPAFSGEVEGPVLLTSGSVTKEA